MIIYDIYVVFVPLPLEGLQIEMEIKCGGGIDVAVMCAAT